jgi:hypothetical protein
VPEIAPAHLEADAGRVLFCNGALIVEGEIMRRARRSAGLNAFSSWLKLATSYAEMTTAAAEVIARRTQRMALAGASPSARDRREFALMGQEKAEAAAHSSFAVGSALLRMHQRSAMQAWLAMLAASTDAMSLAGSRTASQVVARQAKLARTLRRAVPSASAVSTATASLTRAALKPVHSRATRNAVRLRRG